MLVGVNAGFPDLYSPFMRPDPLASLDLNSEYTYALPRVAVRLGDLKISVSLPASANVPKSNPEYSDRREREYRWFRHDRHAVDKQMI